MAFDYAVKIQALIANADDESLSEETRAMYRAKAEELMVKYRIAEEEALAADVNATKPISKKVIFCRNMNSEMYSWYHQVFALVAEHTGVRVRYTQDFQNGSWVGVATIVGYEGDVRYCEFLWTAAYLMFTTRIDPVWDDTRTEAENIFLLRNAGIERRVIADHAWSNGREAAARSKVQRIYLREAAIRGEEARATGLSHNTDVYREAYARSFRDTLSRRLRDARDATETARGGLVLHGRAERVDEAFYDLFSDSRPRTDVSVVVSECEDCKKTKHESGKCRWHRPRKWTQADEARYQRHYNSASARSGEASGAHAAEGVTIARGFTRSDRVTEGDRSEIED